MSYSRWSNSFWYTFWAETDFGAGAKNKEGEVFQICDLGHGMHFNYKELKESVDDCLQRVKEHFAKEIKGSIMSRAIRQKSGRIKTFYEKTTYPPVDVERYLPELKLYMQQFITDVEEEYNK
tara:strand:- start:38 stop:403 length:366 start_codon:yes stop_codon:yes gene_type:complete